MEKIIKYQKTWLRSLEIIDDELLLDFSSLIKISESLAIDDAKSEYTLFLDELKTKSPNIDNIYKLIIKWKTEYLFESSQDFCYISKFSKGTLFREVEGDEYQKIAKIGFDFFVNYKKHAFYNYDTFKKEFCDGLYRYVKAYGLYEVANNFIYHVNNENFDGYLKLPLIENFEVDVFTILEKIHIKKDKEILDFKNEIKVLEKKQIKLKSKNFSLKIDLKSLQNKNAATENYSEMLKNEIAKKDFYPVIQFNELYWGDNYPSLKALFEYLQKNCIVMENWSYFAYQLSIQNLEPINLSTGVIGKTEIGYLLEKIRPYFLAEYRNTKKRYLGVIKRKFVIDNEWIDDNFCKNYIRNYKSAKNWIKTKQEIDILCTTIASRYI